VGRVKPMDDFVEAVLKTRRWDYSIICSQYPSATRHYGDLGKVAPQS
jgi:hypothetical protein